jgi:hypothetical protein
MMQAFMPGGDRLSSFTTGAFEARLHAEIDSPAVFGAAGHMARYTPLVARAL